PYFVSLGPHAFFWFQLQPKEALDETSQAVSGWQNAPVLTVSSWNDVFSAEMEAALIRLMPPFLRKRRWFLGQSRTVRQVEVMDVVRMPESNAHILLLIVHYNQGEPDFYTLPLSVAQADKGDEVSQQFPEFVLARLQHRDGSSGVLYSALCDPQFGV